MRKNLVFSRVLRKSAKGKTVEKNRAKIVGPIIHCSPDLTKPIVMSKNDVIKKPPLCKGRWVAKQLGGVVNG